MIQTIASTEGYGALFLDSLKDPDDTYRRRLYHIAETIFGNVKEFHQSRTGVLGTLSENENEVSLVFRNPMYDKEIVSGTFAYTEKHSYVQITNKVDRRCIRIFPSTLEDANLMIVLYNYVKKEEHYSFYEEIKFFIQSPVLSHSPFTSFMSMFLVHGDVEQTGYDICRTFH